MRLKTKFADFVEKEGWRQLSPRHGDEDDEDTDHDGVAGGLIGSDAEEPPVVKVDGRLVREVG